MPGSIGAGGNQHVFKGLRMAGRMGDERVTVKNLEIIELDAERGLMSVKGAVPGARNGLVVVMSAGEFKTSKANDVKDAEVEKTPATEEIISETPSEPSSEGTVSPEAAA